MKRLKIKCKKCQQKLIGLKPGDIILYNNVNNISSKVVSFLTKTKYIHCGIYIEGKGIHELIWDKRGYRRYPVFRTINHFCKETRILRYKGKIDPDVIRNISKKYEGVEYGLRSIFKILFHRVLNIRIFRKSKYLVCSFIVAKIYEDMGITLFPHLESTEVIPSDFLYVKDLVTL